MKTMDELYLSIIVPLFNEEECIHPLYQAITHAIDPLNVSYEMLFVDDGSMDATFSKARELACKDDRLRVVKFRKNYGQTPAMTAGFAHARGKILVTMDGDLQNDPTDISRFLAKMDEGFDIVCGWRHKRQDKLISRKIPSLVANWIIGKITGVPIRDNGCSLKAYRAVIIKSVPLYSDMHRFIPAMTSLAGTSVAEIKVNHHPRRFGVSKYGISRIYKVIIDLLIIKCLLSFAMKPLRFFGTSAILFLAASIVLLVESTAEFLEGSAPMNFMGASGALLLFILSLFLMSVGFLCELVLKTGTFRDFSHLKARVE